MEHYFLKTRRLLSLTLLGFVAAFTASADDLVSGQEIYADHCAVCHGADLEGQTVNWQKRDAEGYLPAPPHDASGHTWHHPDEQLFEVVKNGIEAVAPPGYKTQMFGFGDVLSDDEIWAVLDFIKSTWPDRERNHQEAISGK